MINSYIVNTAVLFVRAAPGKTSAKVGALNAGAIIVADDTVFRAVPDDGYKWVQIVDGQFTGKWCAIDFLISLSGAVTTQRYVLPRVGLRIRKSPTVSGTLLGSLAYSKWIMVQNPAPVNADGYRWTRVGAAEDVGSLYLGNWVATGTVSGTEAYLGPRKPVPAPIGGSPVGWHWTSQNTDNVLNLRILRALNAAGVWMRGMCILGPDEPDLSQIHAATPGTEILLRVWYPAPDGGKEYTPPGGWDRATRDMGRAHGDWYLTHFIDPFPLRRLYVKYHQLWNEAATWARGFVQWQHGVLDALEARGLLGSMINYPPGFPGRPSELDKDGHEFWNRDDTWGLLTRIKAGGHVMNLHQGTLFGQTSIFQPDGQPWMDDARRDITIYKWFPANLQDVQLVSSEYYFTKPKLMPYTDFLRMLRELDRSVRTSPYYRWVGMWYNGDSGGWSEDNYNGKQNAWMELNGLPVLT